ncbi:hypothetical protein [Halomonas heilongjiangensis]|uniref:hypothetical protein n=1 Tax=Halomonas heilongjiangensis TaxID=1387883 RepID=UPI00197AEF96|nr:hypothetical protein [Halomonas heilongjiangensis]
MVTGVVQGAGDLPLTFRQAFPLRGVFRYNNLGFRLGLRLGFWLRLFSFSLGFGLRFYYLGVRVGFVSHLLPLCPEGQGQAEEENGQGTGAGDKVTRQMAFGMMADGKGAPVLRVAWLDHGDPSLSLAGDTPFRGRLSTDRPLQAKSPGKRFF